MIKFFRQHATVKSITGIVLLLVLFSMIVLTIGFNIFTDALLEQYAEGAYLTAKTASQYVNADEMENYLQSGGEGEAYEQVWDNLDRLCNSSGSTFIYVIIPDITDYAHIQFIFSTIDHNTKYTKYDFGYLRETTNDDYRQKYRLLFEKNSEREIVVRDKGYIETDSHITLLIPLKDSEGNVNSLLCVQRQMDVLINMRRKFLNRALLALVMLILLVLLGQSFFLHRTLLHPLKLISDKATRFSTENTVSEPKLRHSIRNEDEIGLLAGSIDRMEEEIQAYIDNLTKATDKDNELFGTERMLAALNEDTDASPESVLQNVRAAVDGFVKNAEQFDDLTMLCMEYKGDETSLKAYELDIMAENEKLSEVQSFLGQCLAKVNCPAKAQMQMELAAEEIFVNIANYAYAPEKGRAVVRVEVSDDPVTVTLNFIDQGKPYDPLKRKEPDITLPAEEREIGGLGIFLTKKTMDDVSYEYRDGQNILTLKKKIDE